MQDPFRKYQVWDDKPNKKKSKPRKASQPKVRAKTQKKGQGAFGMTMVAVCGFGIVISGFVTLYPQEFIDQISKLRIRAPFLMAADEEAPEDDADQAGSNKDTKVSTNMLNNEHAKLTMENTSLNKALETKRLELEKKERDLARLADDLDEKKQEIDKQLKELQDMRRNIATVLDDRVKADQDSVDKLVDVYSNMKPQNAANIITSLNEDLAIKILSKMKKQNAAEILNFIEPQKAQTLSEKYAGMSSSK